MPLLGGAGMGLVKINCVSSKAWLAFIPERRLAIKEEIS
jgi:hypothetical protein